MKDMRRLLPLDENFSVACIRVNRIMLVSLCAKTIKPIFEVDKSDRAVEGNASVYQVYAVCRTTSEKRVECSKGCGRGEGEGGISNSFRSA